MFKILAEQGKARTGVLETAHGRIETPCYLQVATKGSPKLLTTGQLSEMGAQALITNALLLYLKPGIETIRKAGGLHKFIGWQQAIFTDSGGFQSIASQVFISIKDTGINFRNPFTMQKLFFTPKNSIEIQNRLGSDVAFCLDHMPPSSATKEELLESLERTTTWARECKLNHKNKKQLLAGITQGGTLRELRKQSCMQLAETGFDLYAIGGLGIGETNKQLFEAVETAKKFLPEDKPVHLMGLGSAREIVQCIRKGIDIFDSCFPTRMARHSSFFSGTETLGITKSIFAKQKQPLDTKCNCYVCKNHSAALIHHLFKVKEQNAQLLLSIHNTHFILNLFKQARKAIKEGTWKQFEKKWE